MKESGVAVDDVLIQNQLSEIDREAKKQEKAGLSIWGNEFYKNNPKYPSLFLFFFSSFEGSFY